MPNINFLHSARPPRGLGAARGCMVALTLVLLVLATAVLHGWYRMIPCGLAVLYVAHLMRGNDR